MSTSAVNPVPEGYHTVTPTLTIKGAAEALEFYKKAFGAEELFCMTTPQNTVMHAEMKIGDSRIMLSDEFPDWEFLSPKTIGGTGSAVYLYVPDVDGFTTRAVEAGATLVQPPTNQFYGDRSALIIDPFGHRWSIATHVEDVSHEEIARRAEEFMKSCTG